MSRLHPALPHIPLRSRVSLPIQHRSHPPNQSFIPMHHTKVPPNAQPSAIHPATHSVSSSGPLPPLQHYEQPDILSLSSSTHLSPWISRASAAAPIPRDVEAAAAAGAAADNVAAAQRQVGVHGGQRLRLLIFVFCFQRSVRQVSRPKVSIVTHRLFRDDGPRARLAGLSSLGAVGLKCGVGGVHGRLPLWFLTSSRHSLARHADE